MKEIVLTPELAIPGTRVVPSQCLIEKHPNYVNGIKNFDDEPVKTIAIVIKILSSDLVEILWEGMGNNHHLNFDDLAIYKSPITIDPIIEALDKLELKYK